MLRPLPVAQVLGVHANFVRVVAGGQLGVLQLLARGRAPVVEVRHAVNGVNGQAEAVGAVADGQLQGGVNVALFPVAPDVDVVTAGPAVDEAVHEPGVRVEVEDDGLVVGEEGGPLLVLEAVGVVIVVDELEQVDNVDAADLELGEVLQQQVNGGERLAGRNVAAAGHDQVGLLAGVGAELRPDADALGAVLDCLFHGEVLQVLLLVRYNNVDVV